MMERLVVDYIFAKSLILQYNFDKNLNFDSASGLAIRK